MKKFLILLLFISAVSCSDVGNISIMEKLPIVELNKMIESDSIYSFSTERVKELNQFATTLDSAKYYKITHKSFSEFLLKEYEIEADIDLKNEFLDKWENEYGKYRVQVDSIINYWKNKLEKEGTLDRFIKIEPEAIYGVLMRFRLINQTNKRLSSVKFKYNFTKKNENQLRGDISDGSGFAYVSSNKYFDKSIVVTDNYLYNITQHNLKDLPKLFPNSGKVSNIKKDFNINIHPYSLSLDGVKYEPLYKFQLPEEVIGYIDFSEENDFSDDFNEGMRDLYMVSIINNYLNLGFEVPKRNEMYNKYLDNLLKEDFPLEFDYYRSMNLEEYSNEVITE